MKPIFLGLVALSLVAASLRTDEKVALPKGPQPQQVLAWIDDGGNVLIEKTETRLVPERRQRTYKTNNGRQVTQEVTVYVPVQTTYRQQWKAQDVRAYRADGKQVDPKALPRLLARQTAVLISADGKKVDPFYLQLMKDQTLVLVAPRVEVVPVPKRPIQPEPIDR